jgi:amidase/aspartyl-tRNA(Asn)/glutamyl-tRNA(Gln) amidotransferase subunit A
VSQAQLAAVRPSRDALVVTWAKFFLAHDFLVMAATPFPALAKADCVPANRLRMLGLTTPASLAGLPVLTIPVPLPSGMSAGLQVIVNNPRSPAVPWVLARCRQSSA